MSEKQLKMMQNGTYGSPVYVLENIERLSEFDDGMIMNNSIKGVLNYVYEQRQDERMLVYSEVKGRRLSWLKERALGRDFVIPFLTAAAEVLISAEEYMLIETNFVFDDDYIFVDTSTYSVTLVYVPVENFSGKTFAQYIKEFITNGIFNTAENADYRMRILDLVNSNPRVSAEEVKAFLLNLQKGVAPQSQPRQAPYSQTPPPVQQQPQPAKSAPRTNPVPPTTGAPVAPQPPQPESKQKKSLFGGFGKKSEQKPSQKPAQKSQPKPGGIMAGMAIPGQEVVSPKAAPSNPAPQQKPAAPKPASPQVAPQPAQQPAPRVAAPQPAPQPAQQYSAPQYAAPQYAAPQYAAPQYAANNPSSVKVGQAQQAEVDFDAFDSSPKTVLIGSYNPTSGKLVGYLVNNNTKTRTAISKSNFMIGKDDKNCIPNDLNINSQFVSREHAVIITRGSHFYIIDSGSLNGTYVNGKRLQTQIEVEIHDGDEVSFAKENFRFVINQE